MINNNLQVYKNLKIIVTGSTGFKGAWLCFWLNLLDAKVIGMALKPEKGSILFDKLSLSKKIKQIYLDINNFKKLNQIIKKEKPDIIFHLAAQSLVKDSYIDPHFTISTNAGGSNNILECCRLSKSLKSIVYITSDKCYENVEWIWGYRENDKLGGYDAYSSSKAASENIFSAYLESFLKQKKIGAASARAGNVIGGGDWSKDRIIPDIIRSISSKKKLVIRNPSSTRPWQHVLDPLMGYIILGMKTFRNNDYSGAWNFGPSNDKVFTVKDVVNQISKNLKINKNKFLLKNNKTANFKEARLLKLNCDKANEYLNWKPKLTSTESINLTSDWYKSYFYKKDMFTETQNQIKKYLKKYE